MTRRKQKPLPTGSAPGAVFFQGKGKLPGQGSLDLDREADDLFCGLSASVRMDRELDRSCGWRLDEGHNLIYSNPESDLVRVDLRRCVDATALRESMLTLVASCRAGIISHEILGQGLDMTYTLVGVHVTRRKRLTPIQIKKLIDRKVPDRRRRIARAIDAYVTRHGG